MRSSRATHWIVPCLALLLAHGGTVATPAQAADEAGFNERVLPLVKQFCQDCHSGSEAEAGLSFDTLRHPSHIDDHPDLWEDIADKLRRHEMPPREAPQPEAEAAQAVIAWIDARLQQWAAAQKPNPGRVTMRRLNRFEYDNTIRDLLGIDFKVADDFPADDTGYGFDNIGDVLALPPLLMEKYLSAATRVLDKAILSEVAGEPLVTLPGSALLREEEGDRHLRGDEQVLFSEGVLFTDVTIPADGDHDIVVQAYGQQAGADPVRISVRLDGVELRLLDVPARQDQPGRYKVSWPLKAGVHRIGVAFVNDYYNEQDPDETQRDRNLVMVGLQVRPSKPADWSTLPESHRRIFPTMPTRHNHRPLARKSLERFASLAYRRPVTREELQGLMRLYDQAVRDELPYEQAIQVPLMAVLISPRFLFRVEIDPPDKATEGVRSLNDYELASRLSYFLWSSMPDDELFRLAEQRQLQTSEVRRQQVERMLRDGRARALVDSFAVQWLQLRRLDMVTPDSDYFPEFSAELRKDMHEETRRFVAAIIEEDRPITDLLDADFTFVNERLARHYGIEGVEGPEFRRVQVDRKVRGGIVTHGSVLTLTSNATRTSPVKRGVWVLDNLLNDPPPPPPPGVPEIPEVPRGEVAATSRQRLELHRAPNACGSCHSRIDPLGFGLENFDAIGRWRTHDGNSPVDASGTLPDGRTFNGPAELKQLLVSRREEFSRAFADRMLTYALGRGLTRADRPALDKIVEAVEQHDYRFSSLVQAIVESDPFLKRSSEAMP